MKSQRKSDFGLLNRIRRYFHERNARKQLIDQVISIIKRQEKYSSRKLQIIYDDNALEIRETIASYPLFELSLKHIEGKVYAWYDKYFLSESDENEIKSALQHYIEAINVSSFVLTSGE